MIKDVLQEIGGIGIYGVISVSLFFTVFTIALIWAGLHKSNFCATMAALPLHDEPVSDETKSRKANE